MVTATSDLAERLTRADSSYWHSWGEAVRDLHENPHGVEVFQFGRVSALHVHSAPVPVFNRVLGIGERDTTLIDDILALYGERFTPCRFRIDSIKARFGMPGWTFYMMLVDGVPAGGAALHIADDVATLAGGATMYTLRGRGCQSLAINRRLVDAAEAGCTIAVTRCGVGTPSQRNMERSGFSTAYTKSVWQQHLLL